MKCQQARRLAHRYVTGKLDASAGEALESHLAFCLPCASALRVHELIEGALHPHVREFQQAPTGLRESIRACMDCCERPGKRVCPRLRFKLRLVPSRRDDLQ